MLPLSLRKRRRRIALSANLFLERLKVVTIVGARPQFVKASGLSRELRKMHQEILVHTGQHYDHSMSGVFFEDLGMAPAEVNLAVGSGAHGAQTAAMLKGIEDVLLTEKPDWVLVYGDTNSTLAGALAASKLHVPVAHVEAGLRSYNRRMPEEINRVITDHLSNLLLCPGETATRNLSLEGISKNVHVIGDIMLAVLEWAKQHAGSRFLTVLDSLGVKEKKYVLATIHRSENTDDPERFSEIVKALNSINETVIFPIHPRARKVISAGNYALKPHVHLVEPLGYIEMVALTASARLVLTDSGGLQKEAYWLAVPCVTLREETEWVETVQAGWNVLAGSSSEKILAAVRSFAPPSSRPPLYGDAQVAAKCVELMESVLA
jgi:UDP-GlcNAc3NAcA epimerase